MKKKKRLVVLAAVLLLSTAVTAIPIQAAVRKAYEEEAASYGIDITGKNQKEIKAKVKNYRKAWAEVKSQADEYGNNIEGLSLEEAQAKINAMESYIDANNVEKDVNELQMIKKAIAAIKSDDEKKLMKVLSDLESILPGISSMSYGEASNTIIQALIYHEGIDIRTLSTKEAQDQVEAGIMAGLKDEAKYYGVDVTGLSYEAETKVLDQAKHDMMVKEFEELYTKAVKYNIDITGLNKETAWARVKEAEMANRQNMNSVNKYEEAKKIANQFGIDISGLSEEEAWAKAEEAILSECKSWAGQNGIDINGLTDEEIKAKVSAEREKASQAELTSLAQKYGIDISGMDTETAWKTVKLEETNSYAKQYGIDITGLSIESTWVKIKAAMKEQGSNMSHEDQAALNLDQLKSQAAKYNIVITGLSEQEIKDKIEAAEKAEQYRMNLEGQAKAFNIDPTGMTNAELEARLKDAMEQSCLQDAARVGYQEALEEAKQYRIDTTGLTTAEIIDKVCEAIRYNQMHDSLQQQADAMGISITGMNNDEAQAYILKVDQERRDAADAERNAREDAAREAVRKVGN